MAVTRAAADAIATAKRRAATLSLCVATAVFACASAWAEESVRVRFFPSYPPPDRSVEFVDLSVSRVAAAVPGVETGVDRYMAELRTTLAEADVPAKWGSVVVDAAYVEIRITLGERTFVLANGYGPKGIVLPADASARDKRVAAAAEKVIALTFERASRRASGQ